MSKSFVGLFVILFLGLVCVGLYFGLRWLMDLFSSVDPQIAKVTGIACGTVLLSAVILASGMRSTRGGEAAAAARRQKMDLYLDVVAAWSKALRNVEQGDAAVDSDRALGSVEQRLALWGSPGVIKQYSALRAQRGSRYFDEPGVRRHLAEALFEMRKDLGRQNLGIEARMLLDLIAGDGSKGRPGGSGTDQRGDG